MQAVPLIRNLTILLVFQLIGETGVHLLAIPVPGPVLGMLLLLVALIVRRGPSKGLDEAAGGLLGHLSLLFVPAGVGIMVHVSRIGDEWLAISLTLLLSTVLTMAVTAWSMQGMKRLMAARGRGHD
ncbi:MAG: CidA/LrgA family protein [Gammaproteobacteria bacterium]|nr:CidA/LrgA family protein [Gammaproteobacteria bacterium]MCB1924384.1 CidA/LrgA family protein [Gammaproteobacteria bacterium]